MATYRVESMRKGSKIWTRNGTYGSQQSAIVAARSVAKRGYVSLVRVISTAGSLAWVDIPKNS